MPGVIALAGSCDWSKAANVMGTNEPTSVSATVTIVPSGDPSSFTALTIRTRTTSPLMTVKSPRATSGPASASNRARPSAV